MELEFRLEECTTVQFKYIIKREVVMFLSFRKSKEKNAFLRKFQRNLKRPLHLCQKCVYQKYL